MFFKNLNRIPLNTLKINCRYTHSWIEPDGFRTPIKLYNCVTRKNEHFIPKNKNAVTWYTCGPTVYDSSHIGHAACYVRLDIIQRILRRHFGLNLITCMNITDIDDKIIKKASDSKTDYMLVTKKYEKEFWDDLIKLNVSKPDIIVRVTENIPLIVEFIKKLEDDGVAYKGADNCVYFDVSKGCDQYGKLQNITDTPLDCHNTNKKSGIDFALWKSKKVAHEPAFDSPWGPGRPGWHIECSALASMIFGANIDIHAGGIDLRFPHHENEEAQSCAFHKNKQWVNYWIHTGHLHLKNSLKMSKSLKNTISIQQMLNATSSNVFRLLCALSHYSQPIEYDEELLETATNLLKGFKNFLNTCEDVEKGFIKPVLDKTLLISIIESTSIEINSALQDNFNTSRVLQVLNQNTLRVHSLLHVSPSTTGRNTENMYVLLAYRNLLCSSLDLFGIELRPSVIHTFNDYSTDIIELLTKFRQNVRTISLEMKNSELLKACDSVRDDLNKYGVSVKDRGKVSTWHR